MMKLAGMKDGKPLYAFGLSEGNIIRLKQDMPIVVELEQMGGIGSVMIFYGTTDQELYDKINATGMLKPGIKIHEQKQRHEG